MMEDKSKNEQERHEEVHGFGDDRQVQGLFGVLERLLPKWKDRSCEFEIAI